MQPKLTVPLLFFKVKHVKLKQQLYSSAPLQSCLQCKAISVKIYMNLHVDNFHSRNQSKPPGPSTMRCRLNSTRLQCGSLALGLYSQRDYSRKEYSVDWSKYQPGSETAVRVQTTGLESS